jgi:sigma-B regulation protein RsbU (phosphoserine phosphatase)
MCILVVDDDQDTREIFELLLAQNGYLNVVTAGSAPKAFSFLALDSTLDAPAPVDLIFLDVIMPNLDGIQACARIRTDARYQSVPIVMTTALDDVETIDRALSCGATDYLTKPLKGIDLLACVRSKLRLRAELERRDALEYDLMQNVPITYFLKAN